MLNNKNLKIGDIIYIDILDADNNMLTTLPKNEYLQDEIINITDKYIQTKANKYDLKTNEESPYSYDDYTAFFKKFYQTKEELFAERERFKKYKIVYNAIKNETEYASFLSKLSEDALNEIVQTIQSINEVKKCKTFLQM